MTNIYSVDITKRVPPAKLGSAEIIHDTPDPMEIMRSNYSGMRLSNRKYIRLKVDGGTMMTDAHFERLSNGTPVEKAKGNVLIAGLGIGLILPPIIEKADSVTVIEKNADVIALVAHCYPDVRVIHADIFEWLPEKGQKFDTIYFDIWPNICEDDLEEVETLHKRFRRFLSKGGYMNSWSKIALKLCRR